MFQAVISHKKPFPPQVFGQAEQRGVVWFGHTQHEYLSTHQKCKVMPIANGAWDISV